MKKIRERKTSHQVAGLLTAFCIASPAFAGTLASVTPTTLPSGGVVAAGTATIATAANHKEMDVTQTSDRAVINWSTFDVGKNSTVVFSQPSATSVTLNRVTGDSYSSKIFGAITANGNIFLINPHGVVFGKGSSVNVAGLLATTSNTDDTEFMKSENKNFVFSPYLDKKGRVISDGSIVNNGDIVIKDGGLAALVGSEVTNGGTITANLGKVQLESGDSYTVDLYGDGLINLKASRNITEQLVENGGTITADGGSVIMSAAAAESVLNSQINMDGIIQADSMGTKDGKVTLTSATGDVNVYGAIYADGVKPGEEGGSVTVQGRNTTLASGSHISANGASAGGTIVIGTNSAASSDLPVPAVASLFGGKTKTTTTTTVVAANASLSANALSNGDGGSVSVNGDKTTFAGNIEAKGGAFGGNGGSVETNGSDALKVTGSVNASAAKGDNGEWDMTTSSTTIDTVGHSPVPTLYASMGTPRVISADSISQALNTGTDVSVTTTGSSTSAGNIAVASDITKTAGAAASLSLDAAGSLRVEQGVAISSTHKKLNVDLTAENGSVEMEEGSSISSHGGSVALGGSQVELEGDSSIKSDGGNISVTGIASSASVVPALPTPSSSVLSAAIAPVPVTSGPAVLIDAATIDAGGGNISIHGIGGDTAGMGASQGIVVTDGSVIRTNGSGKITLKGTGGNGSFMGLAAENYGVAILNGSSITASNGLISLIGSGGGNSGMAVTRNNDGVLIAFSGSVESTGTGGVSIDGTGGGNASATKPAISASGNDGVVIAAGGSVLSSGNGALTVVGSGGGSGAFFSTDNDGVRLSMVGQLATKGTGTLSVSGSGGGALSGSSADNAGVSVDFGSVISARKGLISLSGVGGGDNLAVNGNYGISVTNASQIGGPKDTNGIVFVADTMTMDGSVFVQTTGNVAFEPYTPSTSIGIAGAAGTLQLTKTLLDDVTAGSITIGNTLVDSGLITANPYHWKAPVSILNGTGNIDIEGAQTSRHSFFAETAYGNISLGSSGSVSSSATGDAVVLAASNGNFTNDNAAADALSTPKGRWLVYSYGPSTDTLGSLNSTFHRYGVNYTDGTNTTGVSIPTTGNGNIYQAVPTVTVALDSFAETYGVLAPDYASHTHATESYIDQRTNTAYTITTDVGAVTSGSAWGSPSRDVGKYQLTASAGTAPAEIGYGFTATGPAFLTINPATLVVTADDQFKALGVDVPPLTYTYGPLQYSDTASVFSGGLITVSKYAMPGQYGINQGSLSAGSNYTIVYNPGTLTVFGLSDSANATFVRDSARSLARRGPSGTLLSMVSGGTPQVGNLANLAPAAGGPAPEDLESLANLNPAAGGSTVTPLIQCNEATPCDITQ